LDALSSRRNSVNDTTLFSTTEEWQEHGTESRHSDDDERQSSPNKDSARRGPKY
jgi:hypothetical protein